MLAAEGQAREAAGAAAEKYDQVLTDSTNKLHDLAASILQFEKWEESAVREPPIFPWKRSLQHIHACDIKRFLGL